MLSPKTYSEKPRWLSACSGSQRPEVGGTRSEARLRGLFGQDLAGGAARLFSRERNAQQYLDNRGESIRTDSVFEQAIEPEKTFLRFNFRHRWIDNHESTSSVLRNSGSICVRLAREKA